MKIYTKTGDKGTTALFGGERVNKDHIQIESYGTVDELNSFLGQLIGLTSDINQTTLLKRTQSILFDIGSHLASDGTADKFLPVLEDKETLQLEEAMDQMTTELPELKSFIMPGGNQRIAAAHICRTVCRRAERRLVSLQTHKEVPSFISVYLNRLSDYLFVLARFVSFKAGNEEIIWNPRK